MENSFGHHSDQELVAVLDGVLDALTDERLRLESPQQRLGLAVAAVLTGVVATVAVIDTGHSGATSVWENAAP